MMKFLLTFTDTYVSKTHSLIQTHTADSIHYRCYLCRTTFMFLGIKSNSRFSDESSQLCSSGEFSPRTDGMGKFHFIQFNAYLQIAQMTSRGCLKDEKNFKNNELPCSHLKP